MFFMSYIILSIHWFITLENSHNEVSNKLSNILIISQPYEMTRFSESYRFRYASFHLSMFAVVPYI